MGFCDRIFSFFHKQGGYTMKNSIIKFAMAAAAAAVGVWVYQKIQERKNG